MQPQHHQHQPSTKAEGIYLRKCNTSSPLYPLAESPEKWPSCRDAYDYTWKNDPDRKLVGLSKKNKIKLAHSMGFCPHLRCQLGNLSNSADQGKGTCPSGLCYTKLEAGSPSFGACCFINGSFHSGDIIGYYSKCQSAAKPIYKHSRVVLELVDAIEEGENSFVNANRILPHLIATQCPMKETLADVQQMIVQERISMWIQLTSKSQMTWPYIIGNASSKHDCYLIPDSFNQPPSNPVEIVPDDFHQSRVDSLSSSRVFRFTNFTVGSPPFTSIKKNNEALQVQHVWYQNWEDFTIPVEEDLAAIDYISSLAAERMRRGETVAINCFSGRGRTGTLAAIIAAKFHDVKTHDDLVNLIVSMREHRDGLVEIPAQYQYIGKLLRINPALGSAPSKPDSLIDRDIMSDESGYQPLFLLLMSGFMILLPIVLMLRKIAI